MSIEGHPSAWAELHRAVFERLEEFDRAEILPASYAAFKLTRALRLTLPSLSPQLLKSVAQALGVQEDTEG